MEYGQYDSKDINLSIRTTSMLGCIIFLSLLMLSLYYHYILIMIDIQNGISA